MPRSRSERGASAIEMAVIAPAFLLLIFAVIEVALWMHARDVAIAAAQEGVSSMRTIPPGADQEQIAKTVQQTAETTAKSLGVIQDPSVDKVDVDIPDCRVTVVVSGGVLDLIPGWTLHVTGTANGQFEAFSPDFGDQEPNCTPVDAHDQ